MECGAGWWILMCFMASILISGLSRYREYKRRERERERWGVPRGSLGWPFIGETLDFIAAAYTSRPVSFMEKRKSLYGNVFKTHLLGKPVIVSTEPEVNRMVLHNHGNVFVPSYPKSITELFGETSILKMHGTMHKRLHASIARFFKSPLLKARLTTHIQNSVQSSLASWRPGQLVLIQDQTKQITFEILVEALMSVGPGGRYGVLEKRAKARLLRMTRKIVEERRLSTNYFKGEEDNHNDAIDALLRDSGDAADANENQRLPSDFISGNIIEMMVPGEDSVPMAMTLAVKFLSDNPVALKQLQEECLELKKRKVESGDYYVWTDYMSLPFTQNVISETLRMANIINAVWREATEDVKVKGYLIPKGWSVLASFTAIHMDDQIYENPYHFDPWRWEKKGAGACSITFTPFGGGQRLCPGLELARLEISIFLHHLVTTYRWVAEKDEVLYFPTVKMKRQLPIIVSPLI
ncbi:hypothetical protein Nepgr_008346 [Nepenthes gracilis]|uniref:3-epi-6-deoxocathasterone 23-monooxygenase n=1 Tax=Nepenthes gracilis TaxID=150966 RepID=A0AAD3S8W8_NEPGR|nr:hypothetical protein Nepgr_008346 [Nepenthes gracilis]